MESAGEAVPGQGKARAAGGLSLGSPLPPGKHRVRAAQLLKKFIKMSSSTERQSQKWHREGTGRGARDTAVTSQTAEIGKRRTHTHTHANSNGDPTTNGKGKKNKPTPNQVAEQDTGPGRIIPLPALGRVPVPAVGMPHGQDRGAGMGRWRWGGGC